MQKTPLGLTLLLPLLLPACEANPAGDHGSARLRTLADCGEVEAAIRDSAMRKMETQLQAMLEYALANVGQCYWGDDSYDTAEAGGAPPPTSGDGRASEYSDTNNQVAGVDEADFVKTDGDYVYLAIGGSFRVVDAWPPATAVTASVTPIEGTARKLFVLGDRALVYSSLAPEGTAETAGAPSWGYGSGECTYGYNCSFTGDGMPTKITVLDITDRSAPTVVRELWTSGSLIAARRIGSAVHTVVTAPGSSFPELTYWPAGLDLCDETLPEWRVRIEFARLRAENRRIIEETPLDTFVPALTERIAGGDKRTGLLGSCEGFYAASESDGGAMTTVLSLSIDDESPASMATIVSRPGAVYASHDALYMAVPQASDPYSYYSDYSTPVAEHSDIHKFDLHGDPASAAYEGSGVVKGHVLNQFAMDEHSAVLRVATTSGWVPSPDVHSTVTILADIGPELAPIGMVDDIAPTEDIRSVRFDGPRAFIVTFKKTDPLFLLDLSVPTTPRILSELKIPGYSTYMQLMDDRHLLTIGYDADDQGSFAWFQGVMLQIFDVSNPLVPTLAHKYIIGTRGSSSEATTNHLAFNYFAPKDLLAIPMTVCEGGSGGSYGDVMTFSGLMVFDTTVEDGFSLRGGVAHPPAEDITCYNWWTDASSQVKRSIFMEDYVYSISETLMKVNHTADLATDIATIALD